VLAGVKAVSGSGKEVSSEGGVAVSSLVRGRPS
jgi:hypothetical protein